MEIGKNDAETLRLNGWGDEDDFELEDRYLVLKRRDIERYLGKSDRLALVKIVEHIALGRGVDGRACSPRYAVVRSKWANYAHTCKTIEQVSKGAFVDPYQQIRELESRIAELERSVPPNEHGTNRYGLDMGYFRNLLNRELNKPLVDFRPDELARVLARASKAAWPEVLQEREFQDVRSQHVAGIAEYLSEKVKKHSRMRKEAWAKGDEATASFHEGAAKTAEQIRCDVATGAYRQPPQEGERGAPVEVPDFGLVPMESTAGDRNAALPDVDKDRSPGTPFTCKGSTPE